MRLNAPYEKDYWISVKWSGNLSQLTPETPKENTGKELGS